MQKLCPLEVVTGSVNTSRQIEHRNWSSDRRLLEEAISGENKVENINVLI
jgi:hypothetical protein